MNQAKNQSLLFYAQLLKTIKDAQLLINLDDQNEIKDLEVFNVKVYEDGYDYPYDDFKGFPDNESMYWDELCQVQNPYWF